MSLEVRYEVLPLIERVKKELESRIEQLEARIKELEDRHNNHVHQYTDGSDYTPTELLPKTRGPVPE